MEKLYIIGNGFDLHHNLPTSYADYKDYLISHTNVDVKKIDDFLETCADIAPDELALWSKLEEYTAYLYEIDMDEIYEDAANSAGLDMDRASYWHDIQTNAELATQWIIDLKVEVGNWIKNVCISSANIDLKIDKNAHFLNFNYTDSVEKFYEVSKENICYIHGRFDNDIVFGNDSSPTDYVPFITNQYNEYSDIREIYAQKSLNWVYQDINLYCKNVASNIKKHEDFFLIFKNCREIEVMGFSFGCEDIEYMNHIFKNNENVIKVTIYYHTEEDLKKYQEYFTSLNCYSFSIEFLKW